MYDVSSYYREFLVINSLDHAPASERPYEISSATTFTYVPASFGLTYPGPHTEPMHGIAPHPAFLLCFPIQIRYSSCIHLHSAHDALYGMFPMAESTKTTILYALCPAGKSQQRYTVAALVYFLYGLFYLFGAQYLTSMQATERAMSNPRLFFALGALLVILLPPLIYSRFALALSFYWRPQTQRKTLFVDFTLLLGCLVLMRVIALIYGQLYLKTSLHTIALIVAVINAICLIWAGMSRPVWVTRESVDPL
jgi:hypothetical protein